jgi:hypothetical protein
VAVYVDQDEKKRRESNQIICGLASGSTYDCALVADLCLTALVVSITSYPLNVSAILNQENFSRY